MALVKKATKSDTKGTTQVEKKKTKKSTKKTSTKKVDPENLYKCLLCGNDYEKSDKNFYRIKNSILWDHHDKFAPICKKCLLDRFARLTKEYDEKSALIIICSYLDIPFLNSVYSGYEAKGKAFDIGTYIRTVGMQQFLDKDFIKSFFSGELVLNITDSEDKRWSHKDKRSKNRVLQIVGYDPFIGFKDEVRRTIFTLTDDYLNDESIVEDTQKLKSVIDMMVNHGQILTIDETINRVLADKAVLDNTKIKDYIETKAKLQDLNNKISEKNGIATKANAKGTTGSSSLSYHVKQLDEMDFTLTEVNLFDLKTSEALQQISEISTKGILNTLALNDNDYLNMIQDQSKEIRKLQQELDSEKEESRKLRLELSERKLKKVTL